MSFGFLIGLGDCLKKDKGFYIFSITKIPKHLFKQSFVKEIQEMGKTKHLNINKIYLTYANIDNEAKLKRADCYSN